MSEWSSIFPQLKDISDEQLRDRVVNVWDVACEEGGWEKKYMDNTPLTLLVDTGGISLPGTYRDGHRPFHFHW